MTPSATETFVGRSLAVRAERIDTTAWLDQWTAAPPAVRTALQLHSLQQGDLVMLRSQIPFSHFNMVLTLGCPAEVDEAAFEAMAAFYGPRRHWVLVNDQSEPVDLAERLVSRGYAPAGAWDRVVMQHADIPRWAALAQGCELVAPGNAGAWSEFIRGCYDMPALIGSWLEALVHRPGWIHAFRREGGRPDAPIVMARSLFHDRDGWAWLGIDAPVPGVMAPCFDDDQRVVATLLTAAAKRGAHHFVSDIEAPAPLRDSQPYRRWNELGFEAVYLRSLFSRGS